MREYIGTTKRVTKRGILGVYVDTEAFALTV